MQRLRAPLLSKVARGDFLSIMEETALSIYGVCTNGATHNVPYYMDDDDANSKKRWVKYTMLRELLLRLIPDTDEERDAASFG